MNRNLLRRHGSFIPCGSEALEQRCLLASDSSPWHNLQQPTDVNVDGYVSAIDALLIINQINKGYTTLSRSADSGPVKSFYDVNGDFYVSAIDALLVINQINANANNPQPDPASVPTSDSYATDEDVSLVVPVATGVLANDRDGTETITAVKLTDPAHGTLQLNADGSFTYAPTNHYSGADSFTYAVNNGVANSAAVTVSITVRPVNDEPVAVADNYTTPLNTQLVASVLQGVLANDTDADGDTLTAIRKTTGSVTVTPNGTIQLNPDGSFIYTPNNGFQGQDTFRYSARDSQAVESLSALVTINVGNVVLNAAPVAVDDAYDMNENSTLNGTSVLSNDTDADGDTLSAGVITDVQHGTLTLNVDGTFNYVPDTDFFGVDTFEYIAFDGVVASSQVGVVTIRVAAAPRTTADTATVNEDGQLNVAQPGVLGNDVHPEGKAMTATLVSTTSQGVLVFNTDGSYAYKPNANFFGTDSFVYRVSDGVRVSANTSVTISVTSVNDLPVAGLDAYATTAGTTLTVSAANGLLRNDVDLETAALQAVVKSQPANGSLNVNSDGSFTYTPTTGFAGFDSFTYAAFDGTDETAPVTVRLSVKSAATTVEFTLSTVDAAGQAISSVPIGGAFFVQVEVADIRAAATGVFQAFLDVFYDTRLVDVTGAPTFGADYPNSRRADIGTDGIVNEAGALAGLQELGGGRKVLMRIPMQGVRPGLAVFAGDPRDLSPANDVLLFNASDDVEINAMSFIPASLTIIDGVAPEADNDSYNTVEDGLLTVNAAQGVLANDSHPNGLPLAAVLVQSPQNGTVTLNANGSFEYRPNGDFHGSDTFTYVVNDGTINSNLATVTITVAAVDDPPVAQNNNYSVPGLSLSVNAANGVLANDSDIDGDVLTAQLVTTTQNGTLQLNADGSFVYTPRASFVGIDTFTYRAVGNGTASNVASVTLNVDDLTPGSISGFVYTDVNNDGIRGLNEAPIAGLVVTLQGTTASGQPVLRSTKTAGDGSYVFSNVIRGSYTVMEDQPLFMIDGKDTFGGVESSVNDSISLELPPGTNATGVNFGEWGLLPDFARNGNLINRVPTGELIMALDSTGAQRWYCSSLWGFQSVTAQLNSTRTALTITVTTTQGQSQTVNMPVANNPRVQIQGTRPEGMMIRLVGEPADFGINVAALAARAVDAAFV